MDSIQKSAEHNSNTATRPLKQSRKYEINLGQNNEPFKMKDPYGNPLVDKFSVQGYCKPVVDEKTGIAKMRRKQSPKIGILGNSTFSTEAGTSKRKLESIPANTINSVIKNIEE